jgi:hypothetical protein
MLAIKQPSHQPIAMIALERLQRYKSAVYLNNSAVTLLSHGEHCAAMETLSDALSLIKTMVEPCGILSSHEIREFACLRVRQAEQRLARLCTATPVTRNCPTTTSTVPLKVACYDGSLSSCRLNDSNHKNTYAVAITIDDSPNDELCRCIQEIAPTIMLSNFALAHLYVSLSMPFLSLVQRECIRNGARRMLDIGQAVLGVPQRTMQVTEGNMFLALVLANNICCLHQQHESCLLDIDWKRSSQQLHTLRKLSNQMVHLTSAFISLAGAA